jgi:hypothetical protein
MRSTLPSQRRRGRATLPICLAIVFSGLTLLLAELWYLQHRHQDRATAQAEEETAKRIAAAEQQMAKGDWDEAVRLLELAADTDRPVPSTGEARSLLAQARRSQANVLLERARAALAAKDEALGRRLLSECLAHPDAPPEAAALQADLKRAVSADEAARRLHELSDAALDRFEQTAELPAGTLPAAPAVRGLFLETVKRQLPEEKKRRADQRLAQQGRLQSTTAYRDLVAFVQEVAGTKTAEKELGQRQEKALQELFRQLGVNDPREQDALRTSFLTQPGATALAARVEQKRAEVKRAFRRAGSAAPADVEAFDRLVDARLAGL